MILLDTDILVECLRGRPLARQWLTQNDQTGFEIPAIAAMELIVGCRDTSELRHLQKFLGSFRIASPDASDFAAAFELLASHHLGSGLGIPDCVIAAMALNRSARLYSFNLKHFGVVQGLDVKEPYQRF
jgi:predicted nucleic acid-binding protein